MIFGALTLRPATGADPGTTKHVLFFSKAAVWEKKIVHREGDRLSYIEQVLAQLGKAHGIDFTFSKDGGVFTAENLAHYDALMFFTSGDLTFQPRNGRGDNFPLMSLEGKKTFLDAIENGMGFIGCNTAVYTFIERLSPGERADPANERRYTRMIGAGYIGHNEVQAGSFSHLDRRFPGMEAVPRDYRPVDQWYGFSRFMPDLHVIMALHARDLAGNLYERPDYPVAWAHLAGKGRVFYTTMGHTAEMWKDATFQQMLFGGVRWATKLVDADVTPDIATVTPQANEIPERATHFISDHPPVVDAHFPNFKVWLDREHPLHGGRRVLVYTKSAGPELPIVYRDTAWPSPLESELLRFGDEHGIDFVFTKDGTLFTDDALKDFDAILFFTSGNPCAQQRNGLGDNYPLLPEPGMQALMRAVRAGKGFIGFDSSLSAVTAPILGASAAGAGKLRTQKLGAVDRHFPGLDVLPPSLALPVDASTFTNVAKDLHILLTTENGEPITWTRMQGKGRVYYTSLGRELETWQDANFRTMLLGAIQWTARETGADVSPATAP
jgi:hypothetical protein